MKELLLLVFTYFVGIIPAHTQTTSASQRGRCEVWGKVMLVERSTDDLEIELTGKSSALRQRTHIVNGVFGFQSVPAGVYEFRVFDRGGQLIFTRTKSLAGSHDYVPLRPNLSAWEPLSTNTVSFAELGHKIPRQALNAFRAGEKAAEAGDLQKSIECFEKAVAIDSRFVEGEISLAVVYNDMGRREDALQHAQRAFEISPRIPETGYNFVVLLISAKRYVEAEAVARELLANQLVVPEMHAFVAVSLIGQQRSLDEAFEHVRRASDEFPTARLLAANSMVKIGRVAEAVREVNAYLTSSVHECERADLERWLARLNRSQTKETDAGVVDQR